MRSRLLAVALSASIVAAPVLSGTALAQSLPPKPQPTTAQMVTGAIGAYLPVTLWTITGAVIGAVAWPGLAAGTLSITPVTSSAALMNSGAIVGAVAGGVGYLATR